MSKSFRPTLAALVGAASLSVATPSFADQPTVQGAQPQVDVGGSRPAAPSGVSLRQVIDQRLDRADKGHRYLEIDQLGALWLTLANRGQLDRVVERGDGFLNVALRNQRRTDLRVEARVARTQLLEPAVLADVAAGRPDDIEERMDVERFVAQLDQPYRGSVSLALTGMNHREIADELGVSHSATRKWAERLRRRLQTDES